MDIVLQPSQIALLLSSGKLGDDPYTVAGTAMASGSHFSPCPYSLIKAWGFAPQPPLTYVQCSHNYLRCVNQLRH